MLHLNRTNWRVIGVVTGLIAAGAAGVDTQDDPAPTNDAPNPYRTIAPWGLLPAGRTWGALSAVAIDRDGQSVWVADRCGANPKTPPGASAFQYDSCAGSTLAPILEFDAAGALQRSFGAGMFIFPHKIYMADSESNGVAPHPGWRRGIRIGSIKDGKVTAFIPDPQELKGTSAAEGLAVDAGGTVYGAEVGPQRVARHSRQ